MSTKRKTLKTKLDRYFSQYIRLRATDDYGYGRCFTCDTRRHYSEVDAGHFMGRAAMSTRWDERNVQFQCKRCNGFKSGEQYKYSIKLDEVYGEGTADELYVLSKQTRKWSIAELESAVRHYKDKVAELKSEKGLA